MLTYISLLNQWKVSKYLWRVYRKRDDSSQIAFFDWQDQMKMRVGKSLVMIWGNLKDGVWNKEILNRNDKNKISCSNFYRPIKRLLFIFYCLSCLVFSHFEFSVRLLTVLSLEPVNCFASLVCQLQSKLVMPSGKKTGIYFFWKTFCPSAVSSVVFSPD